MISDISFGVTPCSSARPIWNRNSMGWLRAIRAATVTMLRSRGVRPGRVHTSPNKRRWPYCSKAGDTAATSRIDRASSKAAFLDIVSSNIEPSITADARPGAVWARVVISHPICLQLWRQQEVRCSDRRHHDEGADEE